MRPYALESTLSQSQSLLRPVTTQNAQMKVSSNGDETSLMSFGEHLSQGIRILAAH
jgi:hypothetical protein